MLDIYMCKIDIESKEKVALIKKLRELVSIDRKQKIDDYILDDDKLRSAMAEIMIKKVLMDKYGFRKSNIAFKYSKYGKPYLVGCDRIYFNVSHSGKWIVCAFADKEVGIDIQNTDKEVSNSVIDKVCSSNEKELIKTADSGAFYKFWTLKEAYTKALGKGLLMKFSDLDFSNTIKKITLNIENVGVSNCSFYSMKVDKHYMMSICVMK